MGDASTANFTLNTDIPLTMVNANGTIELLSFDEINFNGDTAEAANSLQESEKTLDDIVTIKDSIAFYEDYVLKVVGTYQNSRSLRNLLSNGVEIDMNIKNNEDVTKKYKCTIQGTSEGANSELSCDT